jgi:hypothetical protein
MRVITKEDLEFYKTCTQEEKEFIFNSLPKSPWGGRLVSTEPGAGIKDVVWLLDGIEWAAMTKSKCQPEFHHALLAIQFERMLEDECSPS